MENKKIEVAIQYEMARVYFPVTAGKWDDPFESPDILGDWYQNIDDAADGEGIYDFYFSSYSALLHSKCTKVVPNVDWEDLKRHYRAFVPIRIGIDTAGDYILGGETMGYVGFTEEQLAELNQDPSEYVNRLVRDYAEYLNGIVYGWAVLKRAQITLPEGAKLVTEWERLDGGSGFFSSGIDEIDAHTLGIVHPSECPLTYLSDGIFYGRPVQHWNVAKK